MILRFGTVVRSGATRADIDINTEAGRIRFKDAAILIAGSLTQNRVQTVIAQGDQVACLIDDNICLVLGAVAGASDKPVGANENSYLTSGKGKVVLGNSKGTLAGVCRADSLVQTINTLISAINNHTHTVIVGSPGTYTMAIPTTPASSITVSDVQSTSTQVGD